MGRGEGPCASGLAAPGAGPRGPCAHPSAPIMLYIIYVKLTYVLYTHNSFIECSKRQVFCLVEMAPSTPSRRPPRHRDEFNGFPSREEFNGFPSLSLDQSDAASRTFTCKPRRNPHGIRGAAYRRERERERGCLDPAASISLRGAGRAGRTAASGPEAQILQGLPVECQGKAFASVSNDPTATVLSDYVEYDRQSMTRQSFASISNRLCALGFWQI